METLEFLRRVLPDSGYYVTLTIDGDNKQQQFFASKETLSDAIRFFNESGRNTYYAVGSFKEKSKRTQSNVQSLKSFFIDVDCGEGKPYASIEEGGKALAAFTAQFSLSKPMVVYSGNGLHAYWVLTESVTPESWCPVASALKAAILSNGYLFDPAVLADTARVLRPINTRNPKGGRTVRLLVDAAPVTFEEFASRFPSQPRPVKNIP